MPTYASAADLPPELFPLILQHLTNDYGGPVFSRGSTKYDLFAVSLTCRYWAERCRPHLFRSLSLQTRKHLYEFSELLDQAGLNLQEVTPLTAHLQTLFVTPTESGPPWIHLVSYILRPKLPDHVSIFLGLETNRFVPDPDRPVHSIHHSLPKSVPSFYSQFHSLYLSDVHFRDVMHFTHLVSEVRTLRQLRCNRLTWDKSVRSEDAWQRMRPPIHLERVQADDCTDNWVFLGLFAKRSLVAVENTTSGACTINQDYLLCSSDLQCASEIVAACQGVSQRDSRMASPSVSINAIWWTTHGGYDIMHSVMDFDDGGVNGATHHPPDIMFGVGFSPELRLHPSPPLDPSQAPTTTTFFPHTNPLLPSHSLVPSPRTLQSNILTVVFDLVPSARWCWHPWECNWEFIATLALQLPYLRRIVLGFVSHSNLEHFTKKPHGVALGQVEILERRKLRYAHIQGQGQGKRHEREVKWVSVDPVTLAREEPLVLYDRLVDVGLGYEESRRRGSTVSRLSVRTATPIS